MTSRAESCPPKLVPNNARVGKPNAALRGATQAFSAHLPNLSPPTKAQRTSDGAAAVAAAAGNRAVLRNAPASNPTKQQDVPPPVPIKAPSLSAAQAASARASPQKNVVRGKTPSEPTAMYALGQYPMATGDPVRKQKYEAEDNHVRGGAWVDNTIAIPQPVRPLSHSAAFTAVLGLEPEISPRITPHSASPPVMTPSTSTGMSAARVAAKRATPAAQVSDRSSDAPIEDILGQSLGRGDSLPISKDDVHSSMDVETLISDSLTPSPPVETGQTRSQIMHDISSDARRDSESAASSAIKWTTSLDESLQSASKSPSKNAIAADAVIAWSVASSRAASPARVVQPPTLRRRSKSFGMFHPHHDTSDHHAPQVHAPTHVLKHTLRTKNQSEEKDEENAIVKRGRRHFIRKHQHKHHEGDRKRWRDRVTERERKRYEGVWAANKGLFTFWDFSTTAFENPSNPPAEPNAVLNIVVREIWERSRLPRAELEEVWDLVARENANTLRRDEFVVGMWLLDQRLKGRKLPMRVSPSVWASVRHTLKVRAMPQ